MQQMIMTLNLFLCWGYPDHGLWAMYILHYFHVHDSSQMLLYQFAVKEIWFWMLQKS